MSNPYYPTRYAALEAATAYYRGRFGSRRADRWVVAFDGAVNGNLSAYGLHLWVLFSHLPHRANVLQVFGRTWTIGLGLSVSYEAATKETLCRVLSTFGYNFEQINNLQPVAFNWWFRNIENPWVQALDVILDLPFWPGGHLTWESFEIFQQARGDMDDVQAAQLGRTWGQAPFEHRQLVLQYCIELGACAGVLRVAQAHDGFTDTWSQVYRVKSATRLERMLRDMRIDFRKRLSATMPEEGVVAPDYSVGGRLGKYGLSQIRTFEQLAAHADEMHNCILSYWGEIALGTRAVYRVEFAGLGVHTLECDVHWSAEGYWLEYVDCLRANNQNPSEFLDAVLRKVFTKENKEV